MFDLRETSCSLLYEYTYCKKVTNDSELRDKFEKQCFQRRFFLSPFNLRRRYRCTRKLGENTISHIFYLYGFEIHRTADRSYYRNSILTRSQLVENDISIVCPNRFAFGFRRVSTTYRLFVKKAYILRRYSFRLVRLINILVCNRTAILK